MSLQLAVVGHTNTGKTSLLRTLLRDERFGEVSNQAGTTRHVEAAEIRANGVNLITLMDTPGLEDASGLLDWLETHTPSRSDGIERLEQFLADPISETDFSQEAKVIRSLLQSDVALYVIDAREPVLEKYKDELTVLSWCARPVMPVFNFIARQNLRPWNDMLARRGLHVQAGFDTVAFDFEGEMRLWENLSTLLSGHLGLDTLMRARRSEWARLDEEARVLIADFLVDTAAWQMTLEESEPIEPVLDTMQNSVRQRERQLFQELLQTYRFYANDVSPTELNLQKFELDPFSAEALKAYGIRASSGAAAGALLGLGIDAATAGASMGMGALIGGVLGGILSNAQTLGDKIQGVRTLYVDPATLALLAARALELLRTIQLRGHAAQKAIDFGAGEPPFAPEHLPSELRKARAKPGWSSLQGEVAAKTDRREAARTLAAKLNQPDAPWYQAWKKRF